MPNQGCCYGEPSEHEERVSHNPEQDADDPLRLSPVFDFLHSLIQTFAAGRTPEKIWADHMFCMTDLSTYTTVVNHIFNVNTLSNQALPTHPNNHKSPKYIRYL